jgi:dynactin complex subunit
MVVLLFCFVRNPGKVVFVGEVHYAKGPFVGVIPSDRSLGKNNGKILNMIG